MLDLNQIVYWFDTLRQLPDSDRTRLLESLWRGQLDSKQWLVQALNDTVTSTLPQNIYIMGGWTGILASLVFQGAQFPVNKIRSIDLDPWCVSIADSVCKPWEMDQWRFKAVCADMADYEYQSDLPPQIVINTSTEHVTLAVYQQWLSRLPQGVLAVIQGNDYYSHPQHVRCARDLDDFCEINCVRDPVYRGQLQTPQYTRFMALWWV